MSSDSEVLTLKEVTEYLRATERTIYRLAVAKKISDLKLGDDLKQAFISLKKSARTPHNNAQGIR